MQYVSTRGQAPALGFCDTVLTGLASDGGLYLPETWPAGHARGDRRLRQPALRRSRLRSDLALRRRRDRRCRSPRPDRGGLHDLPPRLDDAGRRTRTGPVRPRTVPRPDAGLQGRGDAVPRPGDGSYPRPNAASAPPSSGRPRAIPARPPSMPSGAATISTSSSCIPRAAPPRCSAGR